MRTAIEGRSFTVQVEFEVDDAFVSPDDGSVSYTISDNAGADMASHTDVALTVPDGATSVVLEVPQAANTIAAGKSFEFRTVTVRFTLDGMIHYLPIHYRVAKQPVYSAQPKAVRGYMGVDASELPDDEIDLFSAYLAVADRVGASVLLQKLQTGTLEAFNANKAIVLEAVKALAPSMPLRIAQSQRSDGSAFNRYANMDWERLARNASFELGGLLKELSGEADTVPELLVVSTPVDPITGA